MTKVRYGDLNQQQKNHICNGCGPKGGWFNPPGWIFTASCDHHDFNYWLRGTETDRCIADTQFYEAMKVDAGNLKYYRRALGYLVAWFYYITVRVFGRRVFKTGKLRTLKDLIEECEKHNIPCDNLKILLKERENDNST